MSRSSTCTSSGKVGEIWKKWFGIDMLYPTGVGPGF